MNSNNHWDTLRLASKLLRFWLVPVCVSLLMLLNTKVVVRDAKMMLKPIIVYYVAGSL